MFNINLHRLYLKNTWPLYYCTGLFYDGATGTDTAFIPY